MRVGIKEGQQHMCVKLNFVVQCVSLNTMGVSVSVEGELELGFIIVPVGY